MMNQINIWTIINSDKDTYPLIFNDVLLLKGYYSIRLNTAERELNANKRLILTLKNDLNNALKRRDANKKCHKNHRTSDLSYRLCIKMIEGSIKNTKCNLHKNTALYKQYNTQIKYIDSVIHICELLNVFNYTSALYNISSDRQAEMIALSNISVDEVPYKKLIID